MASTTVLLYGWGNEVNLFESKETADATTRPILILGTDDCAIIQPRRGVLHTEGVSIHRRYSEECGILEHCFQSGSKAAVLNASASKNIVVYSDADNSLWSFGMNVRGDQYSNGSQCVSAGVPSSPSSSSAPLPALNAQGAEADLLGNMEQIRKCRKLDPVEISPDLTLTLTTVESNGGVTVHHSGSTESDIEVGRGKGEKIQEQSIPDTNSRGDVYQNLRHSHVASCVFVTQIAAGETHCLVLTAGEEAFSFGTGDSGELGVGVCVEANRGLRGGAGRLISYAHTLQKVSVINNGREEKVRYIAAGSYYSAVVSVTGSLFTFGCGAYCRLGHGADEPCYVPTRVRALDGVGGLLPNGTSSGMLSYIEIR